MHVHTKSMNNLRAQSDHCVTRVRQGIITSHSERNSNRQGLKSVRRARCAYQRPGCLSKFLERVKLLRSRLLFKEDDREGLQGRERGKEAPPNSEPDVSVFYQNYIIALGKYYLVYSSKQSYLLIHSFNNLCSVYCVPGTVLILQRITFRKDKAMKL